MIPIDKLDRMSAMLAEVQTDAEADTKRREGLPLTGPVVAAALGEICASYAAIARALQVIVDDLREEQRRAAELVPYDDRL